MNEIKSQCDGEVAKANEENEKAMNKLKVIIILLLLLFYL